MEPLPHLTPRYSPPPLVTGYVQIGWGQIGLIHETRSLLQNWLLKDKADGNRSGRSGCVMEHIGLALHMVNVGSGVPRSLITPRKRSPPPLAPSSTATKNGQSFFFFLFYLFFLWEWGTLRSNKGKSPHPLIFINDSNNNRTSVFFVRYSRMHCRAHWSVDHI